MVLWRVFYLKVGIKERKLAQTHKCMQNSNGYYLEKYGKKMVAGHKIANTTSVWDCNYWWKLGTIHFGVVRRQKKQTQNTNSKWSF